MDADGAAWRAALARTSEIVWAWPPDAGVKPRVISPGRRWLKSPVHRGEHV